MAARGNTREGALRELKQLIREFHDELNGFLASPAVEDAGPGYL